MSTRVYIAAAFIVSVVATVIGLCRTMIHKDVPQLSLALWFPLIVLLRARELVALGLALVQFPALAAVFSVALRRWSVSRALAGSLLLYVALAGIAASISQHR